MNITHASQCMICFQDRSTSGMSFAGAVEDRNMDEMDNVKEVGNGTKVIYVIDILDEKDNRAGENDVVFIEEKNLEDYATKMDILEVRDNHRINQIVSIAGDIVLGIIKCIGNFGVFVTLEHSNVIFLCHIS